MANLIINNQIGGFSLGLADDLYITRTGTVIGNPGIPSAISVTGIASDIIIEGSVLSPEDGIRFTNTSLSTHDIRIGASGSVLADLIAFNFFGDGSDMINAGSIQGGTGISARNDFQLVNSGSILGDGTGVFALNNFDLNNTGDILSAFTGVSAGVADIVNAGTISGIATAGIQVGANSNIYNTLSGTISSANSGVRADNGSHILNDGSILGFNGVFQTGATTGTIFVSNGGHINAEQIGIFIQGGNVANSGVITQAAGISGVIRGGIYAQSGDLNVTNSGSISVTGSGIYAAQDLSLANSGDISAIGDAVRVQGTNADIVNSGTILSQGIAIDTDAELQLQNSGTIGGEFGTIIAGGDTEISNSGEITGLDNLISVAGDLTLANSGTLSFAAVRSDFFDFDDLVSASGFIGVRNDGIISGAGLTDGFVASDGIAYDGTGEMTVGNIGFRLISPSMFAEVRINNGGSMTANKLIGGFSSNGVVTLSNSGQIATVSSVIDVVASGGVFVQNSGSISSGNNGFENLDNVNVSSGFLRIENSGEISVQNHFAVTAGNRADSSSQGRISLTNSGEISAGDRLFETVETTGTAEFTLVNSGRISATSIADEGGSGSGDGSSVAVGLEFSNSGEIVTSLAFFEADNGTSAHLDNSGTLSAGEDFIDIQGGGLVRITNTGDIAAQERFLSFNISGGEATTTAILQNSGLIGAGSSLVSTGGAGFIWITNSGTINTGASGTNQSTINIFDGSIDLDVFNSGTMTFRDNAITASGSLELVNDGVMTAGDDFATLNGFTTADISNSGRISADQTLINGQNGSVFLQNAGTILAGNGILLEGFANVDLRNSGAFDMGGGVAVLTEGDVILRNGMDGVISGLTEDPFSSIPSTINRLVSGANVVVRNDGAVTSGEVGVFATGALNLVNNGSMTAYSNLMMVDNGPEAVIRNGGTMVSGADVISSNGSSVDFVSQGDGNVRGEYIINMFGDGEVRLMNHGEMSAGETAVIHNGFSFGNVLVNNTGLLASEGFAMISTYRADVDLRNQGELFSEGRLVSTEQGFVDVWNTGMVNTAEGIIVNIDPAGVTLRNDGSMLVSNGAAVSTAGDLALTNSGDLTINSGAGDAFDFGTGDVTNSGTITSSGGFFSSLFNGENALTLTNSGAITTTGSVVATQFATVHNSGDISARGNFMAPGGTALQLHNSGTINANSGLAGTVVTLQIDNDGEITAAGNIGTFDTGSFRNDGTISAGSGLFLTGNLNASPTAVPYFINTGTISIDFGSVFGSDSDKALTLQNSGTLTARDRIFDVEGDVDVRNAGTMDAGNTAIFSNGTSVRLVNSGTIEAGLYALTSTATSVDGSATTTVQNSGTLIGGTGAILASEALAMNNSGTILGSVRGEDLSVTNSGTIQAEGSDWALFGTSGALLNAGDILGGSIGANLGGLTRVNNTGSGLISGTDVGLVMDGSVAATVLNRGVISGSGAESVGLRADGTDGLTLSNRGSLMGGAAGFSADGVVGAITLRNQGDISGANGIAIQISNAPGDSTGHVIKNRGLISGDVVLSGGADLFDGRGGEVDGVVLLGGGNDIGRGSNLADMFDGGAGNDDLFGGAGDDELSGGDGVDDLFGGDGNDSLFGGAGNDVLQGNDGDDLLQGDDGNDTLNGGRGDDNIQGGDGNDRLFGRDGNDNFAGGLGDDFMDGGNGDDRFVGSGGNDRIEGGDGVDISVYTGAEADYTIQVLSNGAVRVTDTRSSTPDGVDVLTNVELLQFSDGVIDVAGL